MPSTPEITCSILIDGSNFYHKLKTLGIASLLNFDFAEFATYLAQGNPLVHKRYYVGAISNEDKTEKSEQLHRNQQRLLESLVKHGFTLFTWVSAET